LRVASEDPGLLAEIEIPALLDLLPSGVLVVDSRGRLVRMNETARKLVGHLLDPEQSAVEGGLRLTPTSAPLPIHQRPAMRALQGETVSQADYAVVRPGAAEPLWLRVSAFPLRGRHGGDPLGAVAVLDDVTAEHRAVEHTMRQQHSAHQLRLALEASRMATWTYDIVRDWLEWTPEISSAVGQPVQVLGGPVDEMLGRIALEDRAKFDSALRRALAHPDADLEVESRVLGPEGPPRWVLIKGQVLRNAHGQPERVIGIAMDLTERKEAEAARQMLAQGERLRSLGQMASGIAHDLNQKLALISGYSEMARQELHLAMPDMNRAREMCEITARAAIEGGQALKRLLSFARTQEMLAESEIVDCTEVLREAARLTAPRWRDASQAEGRPIELQVEAAGGCVIEGSASALREAIINLIFNAVDALPRGGTIHLRARRTGGRVRLEVRDSGTGIPADVRPRIFDPFFTTKGERGTGLGLAQVVAIVERHRGTIDLHSEPGAGTTFTFNFPASNARPTAEQDVPEGRTPRLAQRSITILVVDDEAQLAHMAALALNQRGHQVLVARSGEEAIAQLQQRKVELVVSDLGLGAGMNGWDLADAVRRRWPGTRFVLVTGWGAAISAEEASQRGADTVLAKPYRIAELRRIADSVASSQQTR
jgi:PAS domain S-box-containing protein